MKRKSKLPIMPAVVAIGVVAVGAIVLARTDKNVQAGSVIEAVKASQENHRHSTPVLAENRRPLLYYTDGVRGDLFNATPAPVPKPKPPKKTEPKKPVLPPPPPELINPFADYAYTGTLNIGGQIVALVENVKTKEGQYLKQGDAFIGGTIAQISDRTLTVNIAGTPQRLAKTDNYRLTPLDRNAPFMNAQPAQPQPGALPSGIGRPSAGPAPDGPIPIRSGA